MKKTAGILIGIILLISVLVMLSRKDPSSSEGETPRNNIQENKIQWNEYDKGLEMAGTSNKPAFLFFTADWCGYCGKMIADTFQEPMVSVFINEHFIPIMVDSDHQPELVTFYNIRGLPTSLFLKPDLEKIYGAPGYMDAKMFLGMLKYIQSGSYRTQTFQDYLLKHQT